MSLVRMAWIWEACRWLERKKWELEKDEDRKERRHPGVMEQSGEKEAQEEVKGKNN